MSDGGSPAGLALRINRRLFYGWVMLGVGALGYFASGVGQSHLLGVFTSPIAETLDISRTAVSTAYAAATLIAAFGLPYVGRLVDRFGMRRVATLVVGVLGLGAIAFGQVEGVITLALGFMVLRFLGQGAMMLTCGNLVAQWFDQKRGFALSLMSLGFFASVAVHPPLVQWLIVTVGWREAWLWLGLTTWLLLLPPFVLLIQNKPEDIGLRPDGRAAEEDASSAPRRQADGAEIGLSAAEALRTPAFWIIAGSLATFSILLTGLFFHQVSIFASRGLPVAVATGVFSVVAISAVIAVPLFGRLLDRFPTQPIFASGLLMLSLALVTAALVEGVVSAIIYSIAFGLANAAVHAHLVFLWPRFFGRRHLGSIQGIGQTISVVGASIGPIPFGLAFDLFGTYDGALWLFALQPAIFAGLVLMMRPPDLKGGSG